MELQEFIRHIEPMRMRLTRLALRWLSNSDDAEDVVQEALVKLWEARARIDNATKMEHFAMVLVRNISVDMVRKRKQMRVVDTDPLQLPLFGEGEDSRLEERESRQRLRQAVGRLTDKQRALIRMRNVENLTYADIARIMGTTEASVRGMICRARAALMKDLRIDRLKN